MIIGTEYYILASLRRLVHAIRCNSSQNIGVEWQYGSPRKVSLSFLLHGPLKYFNGPIADIMGELSFAEQCLRDAKSEPLAFDLLQLYHELLNAQWLVAAPIIESGSVSPENERWCFLQTLKPDETLLTDLVDAAKKLIADVREHWKNFVPPPPAFRIDLLHQKMTNAGLPVVGCAAYLDEIHPTEQPANFFEVDGKLIRIDWSKDPSSDEIEKARQIINSHSIEITKTPSESKGLKVFLCHASEDKKIVREIYSRLKEHGFDPWLDEEKIKPGQEWEFEIFKNLRKSHIVIACLSNSFINKEGFVQKELSEAIRISEEKPEGAIFIIPLRLEDCEIPQRLAKRHYENYYDSLGFDRVMAVLQEVADGLG